MNQPTWVWNGETWVPLAQDLAAPTATVPPAAGAPAPWPGPWNQQPPVERGPFGWTGPPTSEPEPWRPAPRTAGNDQLRHVVAYLDAIKGLVMTAVIVVFLLLAGIAGTRIGGQTSSAAASTASSATSAGGSPPFHDPDGHFTANFSGNPARSERTFASGRTQVSWTIDTPTFERVTYQPRASGSVPGDPTTTLRSWESEAALIRHETVVSSQPTTTPQGDPALDTVAHDDQGATYAHRAILHGGELFELTVGGWDDPPAGFADFADGFSVTG